MRGVPWGILYPITIISSLASLWQPHIKKKGREREDGVGCKGGWKEGQGTLPMLRGSKAT